MSLRVIHILLLFTLLPTVVSAERQKELIMVALEFEGAIQQNKKGALDFMLQDLAKLSQIAHDYKVMSTARGFRHFLRRKATCLIPSTTYPEYFKGYNVIHSESFARANYIAFTHPEDSIIQNKQQMKGKLIGVLRDSDTWNYEERFAIDDVEYIRVSNLTSLIHMLYKKRIDVAIHDHADLLLMANKLGYATPLSDSEYSIAIDEVVITCHKSKLSQAYFNIINPHLKSIVEEGMTKYYLRTIQQ